MTISSLELFSGAGGLALGFSSAGVEHRAVIEWNGHACQTIRNNQALGVQPLVKWPAPMQRDVRDVSFVEFAGVDLVTGGPPCQPFSMGGKHQAFLDERDMFPQAVRALREVRPKAFVFENVRGLVRSAFAEYFEYILLQMAYPSFTSTPDEEWEHHLSRLQAWRTAEEPPEYHVNWKLVNAADYGVPQQRWRVIFVGFDARYGTMFNFPAPTHSVDELIRAQWVSGDYWAEHGIAKAKRPSAPSDLETKLKRLKRKPAGEPELLRWRTVRDAIADLPDPQSKMARQIQAHKYQPGAKSYPGHTGSPLDAPAKALKAGDHGVPGGENMLRFPDGSVRYFTVRESARLQTFPDTFVFDGTWSEVMRQLGNAVPVALASKIAHEVIALIDVLEGQEQEA